MRKIILLIILFSSILYAQLTNPHFESPFIFSDFIFTDTLILGYDAFATDGLDPDLGEQVVPHAPPAILLCGFKFHPILHSIQSKISALAAVNHFTMSICLI